MFYVYILKSEKDGKLYIGYTSNLKRRMGEHNRGKTKNTSRRLPITLVYYESFRNEDDAKDREIGLKKSGSVYNGLVKRIKRSIEN